MNRIAVAATLAAALALSPVMTPLAAQTKPKGVTGVQIPVGGAAQRTLEKFAGTFTLQRFVNDNGRVVAVGSIAGTITDLAGNVVGSSLQTVAIPVTASMSGTARAASAGTAAGAATVNANCSTLRLDLGPLALNLLGLQIDLSRVALDITAIPGAGNVLGSLLCGGSNPMNNPTGLAPLLNQVLDVIAGL